MFGAPDSCFTVMSFALFAFKLRNESEGQMNVIVAKSREDSKLRRSITVH